ADGNQSLIATVAGHERILTGLVAGQTELSQKLDRLDAATSQDSGAATPIVVSVPEAEGFTWLALIAGLAAGLALAAVLAVVLRSPRAGDSVPEKRPMPDQPATVGAEPLLEHDSDETRVLVNR
ncbi:MAG: hypothetical protein ACRDWA_08185, partial [Acidimicrobiia bacterium]